MIEGAVIALPFLVLIFGILEFGLLFKDYLSVGNTTTASARIASTLGADGDADFEILQAVNESAYGLPRTKIETIIVWHASGSDDTPPATCLAGNGTSGSGAPLYTDACNVYDWTDFGWNSVDFNCLSADGGPEDWWWCPTDRKDWQSDSDGGGPYTEGTDFIGIYVMARYDYITGMFGDSLTLADQTIIRIEPQSLNP